MKGKIAILIMQTIHKIRTSNFRSAAYSTNFQMTPAPVAAFALPVARAPVVAVAAVAVVAVVAVAAPPPPPPPPPVESQVLAGAEDSGTTGRLQRARKIPDYRTAYLGNFQMVTNINNENLSTVGLNCPKV